MFYNPPGFQVNSGFGKVRGIDKGKPHGGTDFSAPPGTTVPAALAGVVVFSGIRTRYGYTVVIRDGAGNYELYAHLIRVKKTRQIRKSRAPFQFYRNGALGIWKILRRKAEIKYLPFTVAIERQHRIGLARLQRLDRALHQ